MEITKEQFDRYEKLRKSGITNMFDLQRVMTVTGLTKLEVIQIMHSYTDLAKKFNSKRKDKKNG